MERQEEHGLVVFRISKLLRQKEKLFIMMSTLFNNYTFYRNFLLFCLDVFENVCCRFIVCEKELQKNNHIIQMNSIRPA